MLQDKILYFWLIMARVSDPTQTAGGSYLNSKLVQLCCSCANKVQRQTSAKMIKTTYTLDTSRCAVNSSFSIKQNIS